MLKTNIIQWKIYNILSNNNKEKVNTVQKQHKNELSTVSTTTCNNSQSRTGDGEEIKRISKQ